MLLFMLLGCLKRLSLLRGIGRFALPYCKPCTETGGGQFVRSGLSNLSVVQSYFFPPILKLTGM